KDGKLIKKDRIIPDIDISPLMKIHFITSKIKDLFNGVEEVIIEDVYYGKNFQSSALLLRLSGAVIDKWIEYKYKLPHLMTASHARAAAGINGHSHKAEVQAYVIDKYGVADPMKIDMYNAEINKLRKEFDVTELSSKIRKIKTQTKEKRDLIAERKKLNDRRKRRMNKLSIIIGEETKIGEDIADSIILGLAYLKESNGINKSS
ncbi:hypothetical protein LCGC14_2263890, partial [marine sediment metagenome]